MHIDVDTFDVAQVPEDVWQTLLGFYRNRDLLELIKRETDLHPITKGFQIVSRNVDRFRKNLLKEMARQERFAAPVYFDWLEDREDLNEVLEEVYDDRGEEEEALTFDKKAVTEWLDRGVDAKSVWIYMHCSADKFPDDAFSLVQSKLGGKKKK